MDLVGVRGVVQCLWTSALDQFCAHNLKKVISGVLVSRTHQLMHNPSNKNHVFIDYLAIRLRPTVWLGSYCEPH